MSSQTTTVKIADYWIIRENILIALKMKDDSRLKQYAKEYPGIFQNLVNQAKNAMKDTSQ